MELSEVFYDKTYTCPLCHEKFQSKKVRSRYVQPIAFDEDFCPHYADDLAVKNPIFYRILVCPHCGFAYSEQASLQYGNRLQHLQHFLQENWTPIDYGSIRNHEQAIATYKLAIFTANTIEEEPLVTAGYCLRLAWIYRYLEEKESEDRFLRLAVHSYKEAYDITDFSQVEMSEEQVLYLLGELQRRLQHYQEAIHYFNRCIEVGRKTGEQKMVKRAREQWQLTRQEWSEHRIDSVQT